jgi:2-polyprenyl-3-methyl-5-hydroxy-6-metoxy-1,4-benzoquinol methylase
VATILYARSVDGWKGYRSLVENLIDTYDLKTLCDIGGGANPVLTTDFISRRNLDYTILDISESALNKAPKQYKKIAQDITEKNLSISQKFDLIFTRMLAEHVRDGELLHRNVYSMLNPRGYAVHFFPTLYALPFLINRVVPERIASALLDFFVPRDKNQQAKFPAYYDWCRGPTKKMTKRFTIIGFEIVEYKGFFGHEEYYKKIPWVQKWHKLLSNYLLRNPNPHFTSYAWVILRKPAGRPL